ncbi:protein dispatched homolog 1-like isoform X2 [Oscarella lobularis]|uniref:protein dispatched homolog 1-like isoform X2 n=1 Tax=Oscarella lobularis TaxID=121494 RepID=UPI0033135EE5
MENAKTSSRYARLIGKYPWAMLLIVFGVTVVCGVLDFVIVPFPSFEEPAKGFASRNTDIVRKIRTVQNVEKYTADANRNSLFNKIDDYLPEPESSPASDVKEELSQADTSLLCTTTGFATHIRVVFEADFTLEKIHAMCLFSNNRIRSRANFSTICLKDSTTSSCCPDVSLGNVIAAARNVSSCSALREVDIDEMRDILIDCAPWYGNNSLTRTCAETQAKYDSVDVPQAERNCFAVPRRCTRFNAVYIILHYLVDIGFVDALVAGSADFPKLTYALTLYQTLDPVSRATESEARDPLTMNTEASRVPQDWYISVYEDLFTGHRPTYDGVTIAGHDLDIAFRIFSGRFIGESLYIGISLLFIFVIMWIYTQSFFITSMGSLAIVFAMVITYFLYYFVFRIEFFGYLNLLSFIVVIGVGADDVFVYLDIWRHTKTTRPDADVASWIDMTLKHAALAMFVTSFTTATAFYTNAISAITALRVFGIFAGTAIIMNYLLMITWLPAVIVIHEKYFGGFCGRCCRRSDDDGGGDPGCLRKCFHGIKRLLKSIYGKFFPRFIVKFRFLLVGALVALAIAAAIAVFYKPRLRLPSNGDSFQIFTSSESLATYQLELEDQFNFEVSSNPAENENVRFVYTFVWGIKAEDRGNHLDPSDEPVHLTFQSDWESGFVFTRQRQAYFLDFCRQVRNESFYQLSKTCFASEMDDWLASLRHANACVAHETLARSRGWVSTEPYDLCCNVFLPVDSPTTFETCLKRWANGVLINRTAEDYFGVKFDGDGNVKAVTSQIVTKRHFTWRFNEMADIYDEMNRFMDRWSGANQPAGLRDGWVSSSLFFYDTQRNLFSGTLTSLGVALSLAFFVLFITTFNIVVSFYAIVTIGFVLLCVIGTVVLIGWELNVVESVVVALAVGLAVDFTVHFGVAYRLSPEPLRRDRTLFAVRQMGQAISMAALTTFVAGAMMMPASIINLFQIGLFLMLVMTFSWLYANFFFLPLCAIAGPQNRFGQVPIPRVLDCYASSSSVSPTTDDLEKEKDVKANGSAIALKPIVVSETQRRNDQGKNEKEPADENVEESQDVATAELPNGVRRHPLDIWTDHGVQVAW